MIWRPWRRIRALEEALWDAQSALQELRHQHAALGLALRTSTVRYDRIRDTNLQLRDALELYRSGAE
jgi:hypothetical protein